MNVHEKILGLKSVTGYDVSEDIYEGKENKYITFNYEDERPDIHADNKVYSDVLEMNISFFCPQKHNYLSDKHKIRDYLESLGFEVSIQTWLEDNIMGSGKIRRVLFSATYTERRKQNG